MDQTKAISRGNFCGTIFGLAVLTGIGFVIYSLMPLIERLANSFGQYTPVVFASVSICGGMFPLGLLGVIILYFILTNKKK